MPLPYTKQASLSMTCLTRQPSFMKVVRSILDLPIRPSATLKSKDGSALRVRPLATSSPPSQTLRSESLAKALKTKFPVLPKTLSGSGANPPSIKPFFKIWMPTTRNFWVRDKARASLSSGNKRTCDNQTMSAPNRPISSVSGCRSSFVPKELTKESGTTYPQLQLRLYQMSLWHS